jgi:hypothetical protein
METGMAGFGSPARTAAMGNIPGMMLIAGGAVDLMNAIDGACDPERSGRHPAPATIIAIVAGVLFCEHCRQTGGRLSPAKQGRRGGSRLDAYGDFIVGMIEEVKDIRCCLTLCVTITKSLIQQQISCIT